MGVPVAAIAFQRALAECLNFANGRRQALLNFSMM
jgi:hypothetical protein